MIADLFVKDIDAKSEKFMKKQIKKAKKEQIKQNEIVEEQEIPDEIDAEQMNMDIDEIITDPKAETEQETKPKVDKVLENKKTVFVGNVDLAMTKNNEPLKELFSQHGEIQSLRFRSIPRKRLLKRADAMKHKQFNENRKTCNAYIIFTTVESADSALMLNGHEFLGHVLRVDRAMQRKQDNGVFVGNLTPTVEEMDLHLHFKDCGDIDYIRCIRDRQMNLGKGIAYVVFKEASAIRLALRLNGTSLQERKLRVTKIENQPKSRSKEITGKDVAKRLKKLKNKQPK